MESSSDSTQKKNFKTKTALIIIINHSLDLPLRFCTGGPRWPYSRLKSIPSTENGSDANKTPNNVNQIIFDIFSLVLYTFLANSIVCCKYSYISVARWILYQTETQQWEYSNCKIIYENETKKNTPCLFRCLIENHTQFDRYFWCKRDRMFFFWFVINNVQALLQ